MGVIIWAIDPFERPIQPGRAKLQKVLEWANLIQCKLLPVYVVSVVEEGSKVDLSGEVFKKFVEAAQPIGRLT